MKVEANTLETSVGKDASRTSEVVPSLELRHIQKSFAGVSALDDVSFAVVPGEIHALLGENGAGKSTLMSIASGILQPDSGEIFVGGERVSTLRPARARELGIAIVNQHPAVMPDLTVEENLRVALPRSFFAGKDSEAVVRSLLERVALNVRLKDRVELLSVAQKHLLEVAKALAIQPKILILDEPTAPLGKDSVDLLFELIRSVAADGTSVIYITHRMAEVRELSDRVTVLRDGQVRGLAGVDEVTDRALLGLIVGRQLDSTFPEKHSPSSADAINFEVSRLSGRGFTDVSFTATPGEVIGIAGVVGNGQSELLRALAGLEQSTGTVRVSGVTRTPRALLRDTAYMPSDRQHEGLMLSLSVRENAAVSALSQFRRGRLLSRKAELGRVVDTLAGLAVKAASTEVVVSSLSGGNQQKVVMARALLSGPTVLIADEPTQGVDVGARAEIYRILREVSTSGIPVVIASSDSKELEGICDKVIVMSRGQTVETLAGEEITEERIVNAAVTATSHSVSRDTELLNRATSSPVGRFFRGDYSPSALLIILILALAGALYAQNSHYLSSYNIASNLLLIAALGFIAVGENVVLLIGGIDLSVGPLAGFLVIIGSFYLNSGKSFGTMVFGFALMFVVAGTIGLINGSLIRYLRFTPIAATLAMYIALQGASLLLRGQPGGYISQGLIDAISYQLGPVPVAFIVLVVVSVLMELALRNLPWGWRLRATGSHEESAQRVGVAVDRTHIAAYSVAALFVFLGAVMLAAQIGVGDPAQGTSYTLTSITAVVLGGTSLLGGRGSFIGTMLGAVLLTQVLSATSFAGLSQYWQYFFQGILIILAAVAYTLARFMKRGSDHG